MLYCLFASSNERDLEINQYIHEYVREYDMRPCRQYLDSLKPLNGTYDSEFCREYLEHGWQSHREAYNGLTFPEMIWYHIRTSGLYY